MLKKLFKKNKKGMSTGFAWIFGLVSIFGLGLMYIVFSQVFEAHLVPVVTNMVNDSTINNGIPVSTQTEILDGIDKYMTFFHIMPFVLFFIVILYMIVVAVRKERESEYL